MSKLKINDRVAVYDDCRYTSTIRDVYDEQFSVVTDSGGSAEVHSKQCRELFAEVWEQVFGKGVSMGNNPHFDFACRALGLE